MEENGKKGSNYNQVPGLDDIKVSIVAGLKRANNTVQNVNSQDGSENLLKFKNEIPS